jgi:hypothetical protein
MSTGERLADDHTMPRHGARGTRRRAFSRSPSGLSRRASLDSRAPRARGHRGLRVRSRRGLHGADVVPPAFLKRTGHEPRYRFRTSRDRRRTASVRPATRRSPSYRATTVVSCWRFEDRAAIVVSCWGVFGIVPRSSCPCGRFEGRAAIVVSCWGVFGGSGIAPPGLECDPLLPERSRASGASRGGAKAQGDLSDAN